MSVQELEKLKQISNVIKQSVQTRYPSNREAEVNSPKVSMQRRSFAVGRREYVCLTTENMSYLNYLRTIGGKYDEKMGMSNLWVRA